jgi:hypothetical protein
LVITSAKAKGAARKLNIKTAQSFVGKKSRITLAPQWY